MSKADNVYDVKMRVVPLETPGHAHVTSEGHKEKVYDVDVLAHAGQGHCTCDDWLHRIGPCIARDEAPPRRFCKHQILVREVFTDWIIQCFLAQMTGTPPPPWSTAANG